KMTSLKMKKLLEEKLAHEDLRTTYNRNNDTFRVELKESKQGVSVTLPNVVSKYNERGEEAIQEIVDHISEALKIMNETHDLKGKEKHIYPVIRATSFPTKTNAGDPLIYKDHTAETRVFYALD